MLVTFFSNFLNDHQIPFCNEMYKLLKGNFRFVATEKITDERLNMRFEDVSDKYPYAVNSYESEESYNKALQLGLESDVVIIGSAPDVFIEERLKRNKLTFRYYERYFKEGRWRILDPRVFLSHYKMDMRYKNKPLYMLCASAYTAPDCHFIGCYKNKTFKWGYFPEMKTYNLPDLMAKKKHSEINILWVGRMISWKHPEMAVELAECLKNKGYDFELTMIGEGEMRKPIEKMVRQKGLNEYVSFLNFMPQSDVRSYMEKANIFLFTSDRQEGWGAVLNESMNSGCAVVANDEIGSVPFLVENGVNGLSYHHSVDDLTQKVEMLMKEPELIEQFGIKAYNTMKNKWNASSASERLVKLFEGILQGEVIEFDEGPVSRA